MSKQLVAVHNYTDKLVALAFQASRRASWSKPPVGKGKYPVDTYIPDNSDSAKYFHTNHNTVIIMDPETKARITSFSFWDNDDDGFKISYCDGIDWEKTTKPMRGGDKGGNGSKIILHVSEHPEKKGTYELTAFVVTEADLIKSVVNAFQDFRNHPDIKMTPGTKYTKEQIWQFMNHPSFQAVVTAARVYQFKSIALIIGGGLEFIAEGQASMGILFGIGTGEVYYMVTSASGLGVDAGAEAFIGVYMSRAVASDVAGFEFFCEMGAGYGVGVLVCEGFSLSWNEARSVLITGGIEFEFGFGVAHTTLSKLSS